MNGERSIPELAATAAPFDLETIEALVTDLDELGVVDDAAPAVGRSGLDVLLELEDLFNDLLYASIYENVFWRNLLDASQSVPHNVLYGMCIENYHLLFRESYFDTPALSYPASTRTRVEMNEFYHDEHRHDDLFLKSLISLGLTPAELQMTIPLPQTMALCNALAYWSRYEPVFFFATIGVLEGKDLEVDSYVKACERHELSEDFIGPIRTHSNINIEAGHGNASRDLFRHLGPISSSEVRRLRALVPLFVEIYNAFYVAVWEHYSESTTLLRLVPDFER
jgi:hypothetical protein